MFRRGKARNLLNHLAYLKQERGAIFVMFALLLPVTLGFLGFAYDVGNLYMHKARLQNVTDAAALAGAGVFKNPPNKAEPTEADEYISATSGKVVKLVNNVEVVVKEIQNVDYKDGTTIKDRKGGTTVTTNSPNHVKADLEAKSYIEHNAVNLGNPITTEELSALAYNDSKTTKVNGTPTTSGNVTTTVNTETTKVTDAKFYRVIASEEVPLYFLPVILGENKRTQTVRTTSVAMLDNTTTTGKEITIIEREGGSPDPFAGKTILDNLFTVSDYLYVVNKFNNPDLQGSLTSSNAVASTFDGDIVYTKSTASLSFQDVIDITKTLFPHADAKGLPNVVYELVDHAHYANLNTTVGDIGGGNYLEAFKNPFYASDGVTLKDTAIPLSGSDKIYISDLNTKMKAAQQDGREGNVFYDAYASDGSVDLYIDEPLDPPLNSPSTLAEDGSNLKPVYFLFNSKPSRGTCKIKVQCKMVRPLVVVWLQEGGGDLTVNAEAGSEFHGVIYAPYKRVNCHDSAINFKGNIITKELDIQSEGESFKKVNYLKNETEFRNITKITSTGSNLTQEQYNSVFNSVVQSLIDGSEDDRKWKGVLGNQYYSQPFERPAIETSVFEWIKNNYSNTTGDTGIGNLSSLPNKDKIIEAWIIAYKKTIDQLSQSQDFQMSDLNKISRFPWDDNYIPSSDTVNEGPANETNEKNLTPTYSNQFRLINPRTETNPYFAPDSDI